MNGAYSAAPDSGNEPLVQGDANQNSKLASLQRSVEQVKGAMNKNINIALANGSDLEGLELKSQELNALSQGFHANAKKARRQQQWRRIKATGAVIGIAAGCIAAPILL
jgi:hypothetical protein